MIASRTLRAVLLSAVLALPTLAEAQPYTMLVTFTQPLVDGSDPDTHVDNPIIPIAPPTTPGTYGLVTYVARGGPGVGPITEPGYVAGAAVRLYYNANQMEAPSAPAGVIANIVSRGDGLEPRRLLLPASLSATTQDTGNGDSNAATTHFVVAGALMATADPSTPLYANSDPSAARFRLPVGWAANSLTSPPGAFEPLFTTNVVVKPNATFPLQIGTTPNPPNGSFGSRRLDDDRVMPNTAVYCASSKPGQIAPPAGADPWTAPRVRGSGLSVQIDSPEGAPTFVAYFLSIRGTLVYQGDSGWITAEDYDVTFPNWPYSGLQLVLQGYAGDPSAGVAGIYPLGSTRLNGTVVAGRQ